MDNYEDCWSQILPFTLRVLKKKKDSNVASTPQGHPNESTQKPAAVIGCHQL